MISEQRAVEEYVGDVPKWWKKLVDDDRIGEFEKLAAVGFQPKKIAMYFMIPPNSFMDFFDQPYSPAQYHYNRGRLMQQAKEGMTMAADAATGKNSAQAQRWDKVRKSIEISSAIDEICFSDLIFD